MGKKNLIIGWTGVSIAVLISGFWAYWGAFENFHEGWYSESLGENLLLFVFQYMSMSLLMVSLAVIALKWKKTGLWCCIVTGVAAGWFLTGSLLTLLGMLIAFTLSGIGFLYYYGEPVPKKWAYRLVIMVPLLIALLISIPQYIKVSQRLEVEDDNIVIVKGNDVVLAWAPRGPGWPGEGVTWEEAKWTCAHLSEDGSKVVDQALNIWRLPTVDEAVRSMKLHNENAEGEWDATREKANYMHPPDKEYPLWDRYSKVIYYWTNDVSSNNVDQAMIIVYNGQVHPRTKTVTMDSLSFRAVKDVE